MKTLLALLLVALLGGCAQHLPTNAYMKGVKSEVNTPWGPSKLDIDEVATGTAAVKASAK